MATHVTIKQLKAFIAIAQYQSFAEACTQLNLSQPALSIAIKNLEQTLGGSLLTRSTRTLALTQEGKSFLPAAKRLLADWDEAITDVSNMFSLKRGKLSMASMPFFAASHLPKILVDYQRQYPNINISLNDVVNERVIESVRNGRTELGICFNPGDTDDLTFLELFNEEFIAILPADNSLIDKDKVSWADLFEYPFLALQHPSSLRKTIRRTMTDHGIPFSVHLETHQLTTIGEMVAAGMGVSTVPKSSTKQMTEMGAICRPLVNPLIAQQVGIIYRRRYELSVASHAMKEFIIHYFEKLKKP